MEILSAADGWLGKLDQWYFAYHCFLNRKSPPMFHKGWGSHEALAAVNSHWQSPGKPAELMIEWEADWKADAHDLWFRNGSFASPSHREHLPAESRTAYFRFVRPVLGKSGSVVVLTPTSREEGVDGRLPIARALARQGVATVLLESPFMGRRKPQAQYGATLSYFSDFLVLSAACIEEARSVLAWLSGQSFHNICIAGISKGGYLAAVAALRSPVPVHAVSLLAPHSGAPVLLEGLLGSLCDWSLLQATSGSSRPVREQMADLFEQTSLERLPLPDLQRRLTLVGARRDHYVPAGSYERMQRHWANCATVRWLRGGHVSSIAERRHVIRAITEALEQPRKATFSSATS